MARPPGWTINLAQSPKELTVGWLFRGTRDGCGTTARGGHTGGVNVVMCDGSVRFVRAGVSLATGQALGIVQVMTGQAIPTDF